MRAICVYSDIKTDSAARDNTQRGMGKHRWYQGRGGVLPWAYVAAGAAGAHVHFMHHSTLLGSGRPASATAGAGIQGGLGARYAWREPDGGGS